VPFIMLQPQPLKLMPQRYALGCLCETLGDRAGSRIAAPRVCAPEREQHRGLVGRRLRTGLQVRNRIGVAAKLDERQAEELPGLQQRRFGGMNSSKRLDRGGQCSDSIVREPQVQPRGCEPGVDRQRALFG
jgi:hypothetical protein